jgi:hypothetical protein
MSALSVHINDNDLASIFILSLPSSAMPATIPNTLVAFGKCNGVMILVTYRFVRIGANEDSFFLGHGRRHTFRGVTDEFAAQVQGGDLPITQTEWISYVSLPIWLVPAC